MASARRKKEKEQFFQDLARLDQFIDDDGEDTTEFSLKRFPRSHEQVAGTSPPAHDASPLTVANPVTNRKRKASASTPRPTFRPSDGEASHVRPSSSPVRDVKKGRPARLKRSKSDLDKTDPLWRKGDPILNPIADDRQIFKGYSFHFVPSTESKLKDPIYRLRIRVAVQHGAHWSKGCDGNTTHIIVCDGLNSSQLAKCFSSGSIPPYPIIVLVDWVVDSVRSRYPPAINSARYQVAGCTGRVASASKEHVPGKILDIQAIEPEMSMSTLSPQSLQPNDPCKGQISSLDQRLEKDDLEDAIKDVQQLGNIPLNPNLDSDLKSPEVDQDDEPELRYLQQGDRIRKENAGFQCMEKNDGACDSTPNMRTIEILQQMATYYDRTGDHWRTTAYRKGIAALRKQTQLIRNKQEALAIPQIGDRLAEKIEEIVCTDRLQRLEYAKLDQHDKILQLFMGIYQVGYSTASRWVSQGYRTLDDLATKAELSANQRIGIEHYDDFQQRIPRAEVASHADIVEKALKAHDQGLKLIIGGSYRRGSPDSGDIDLIITKEGASLDQIRTLMVELVIPSLRKQEFLTAALATGGSHETSSKWHGACTLPGSQVWRRIDLLFVPWAELGAALIYFTGNDIFNRSLRLLASRKQMRLNQQGLYADVMRGRGRERITDGTLLEGHDEKRIFEILGVPYRPPEHRQC